MVSGSLADRLKRMDCRGNGHPIILLVKFFRIQETGNTLDLLVTFHPVVKDTGDENHVHFLIDGIKQQIVFTGIKRTPWLRQDSSL